MATLFCLRAFGDFTIALYATKKSKHHSPFQLVASRHLASLYNAIPPECRPANIQLQFHDFGIEKSLMRCFTNRYFFSFKTITELLALRRFIKGANKEGVTDLYLEQKKRILLPRLFAGYHFKNVADKQNIYTSYADIMQADISMPVFSLEKKKGFKLLVLPDARLTKRNIRPAIVHKIFHEYCPAEWHIKAGFFRSAPGGFEEPFAVYQDFQELILLIREADFVIGADSLPVHLCQYFDTPHYILYPAGISQQFFTPFALFNNSFSSFDEAGKIADFFIKHQA
ncbi:MAG: hypothetical protein JWN76_946 [Chitinophagaceae bacterium]|nr:hypothetical protein [Chitinophagaceae bacterium]